MNRTATLAEQLDCARLDWIVPDWPVPEAVHALSTTRNGGVCTGPHASLDLALASAPRAGNANSVAESRRRLAAFLPAAPVWLDQCHGIEVATLDRVTCVHASAAPPRADAAVTRERGIVLAVLTADCLPVVLADRRASAVGIAHAGWRGLAAGVVEATIAALAIDPSDIVAWLGPAIGPNAFEVGADVVDAFCLRHGDDLPRFRPRGAGKWLADLEALARSRLARSGVHDVHGGGFCTVSDANRF